MQEIIYLNIRRNLSMNNQNHDSFCNPLWDKEKQQWLYGSVAREKRIKSAGGIEKLIKETTLKAVKTTIQELLDEENNRNFKIVK